MNQRHKGRNRSTQRPFSCRMPLQQISRVSANFQSLAAAPRDKNATWRSRDAHGVKPEARLLLACRERIEVLQRAQMKHVDPRIHELFRHLRGAVDLLEQLILQLAALPPAEQATQSKSKPEKPFDPTAPPVLAQKCTWRWKWATDDRG
jgi:hypothetical protein